MIEQVIEQVIDGRVPRPDPDLSGAIVVGVADRLADGERGLWEAALWAARRQLDVALVTAAGPATEDARRPGTSVGRHHRALRLVDAAAHRVARCAGDRLSIHTAVLAGPADAALVDLSASAALLVLQRRELGSLSRLAAGSTTERVAARAGCPVLIVHDHDQVGARRGLLAVLDGPASAVPCLTEAFPEAARRGVALTVAVLVGAASRTTDTSATWWSSVAERDRLRSWQERFPQVRTEQVVVNRFDDPGLLRLVDACELVLVARRAPTRAGQLPLGAVTRRLIERSRCPVLVLPPVAAVPGVAVRPPTVKGRRSAARSAPPSARTPCRPASAPGVGKPPAGGC